MSTTPTSTWLAVLPAVLACLALAPAPARANLPAEVDGRIAYQHGDDVHGQVWTLAPDAAAPEAGAAELSDGSAPEARPAWGPVFQGGPPQHLAFQRWAGGNWDIWDRAPWSGPAAPLVTAPGDQTEPVYSDAITPLTGTPATGKALLAYISDQTGRRELWLRDGTGSQIQLTADGLGYGHPDFGGRFHAISGAVSEHIDLGFESSRSGEPGIWTMDLTIGIPDGALLARAAPRLVVAGPDAPAEPSWQVTKPQAPPAGRVADVAFTTHQGGSSYLDYAEEPVTPALPFSGAAAVARYQLTGDPGGDQDPVWAPFGDRIAFTRTVDGNADVWVTSADGTSLRRLTASPEFDGATSWQPGQESDADVVGGHTAPGPVTRTPKPTGGGGGPGNGGGDHARRPPGLKLDRATWRKRRVAIAGHAAPDLARRVQVTFRCGTRARMSAARRVRVADGRLRTTLDVPRRCRRVRGATVTAAYAGDDTHLPGTVSRHVRRH